MLTGTFINSSTPHTIGSAYRSKVFSPFSLVAHSGLRRVTNRAGRDELAMLENLGGEIGGDHRNKLNPDFGADDATCVGVEIELNE